MTTSYFKDAPEWADVVLFSEEKNANIFAFTKIHSVCNDGKDTIIKLFSWPDFDHPRKGAGKFNLIAKKDRDFSIPPIGIDKDFYDSICASKATSLMEPLIVCDKLIGDIKFASINPEIK